MLTTMKSFLIGTLWFSSLFSTIQATRKTVRGFHRALDGDKEPPVNLGTSGNYAILAESSISVVQASQTGAIAIYPPDVNEGTTFETPIDTINMGACEDFAYMARSTSTCAGSFDCTIGGDFGVSPGTAITGPFVGLRRSTPKSAPCSAAGLDALNSGIARAGEVAVNMVGLGRWLHSTAASRDEPLLPDRGRG
jgi:hypothetical protein